MTQCSAFGSLGVGIGKQYRHQHWANSPTEQIFS